MTVQGFVVAQERLVQADVTFRETATKRVTA